MDIAEFRAELHAWLDAHHDELAPPFAPPGTLDEHIAQMQRVKAILFDAGWMRWGWPERVGGLGGSPMLRTELGAALAARDLADPGLYSLVEVLAPTLIDFAPPELAAEVVPAAALGRGDLVPGLLRAGTGQRPGVAVAAAPCPTATARRRRRRWVINGQKVWTSLAQYSDRCVLLTRTGPTESRHRGITAFFVDMDTPGITVAPIEMINGVHEFAEVFFDDVVVPADRMLGEVDGGWAVAMSILPYERSSCFWQRIAYLYRRLQLLVEVAPDDDRTAGDRGRRVPAAARAPRPLARHAAPARRRRRRSARRRRSTRCSSPPPSRRSTTPSAGCCPGSSSSTTRAAGETWRTEYLYSRAATIYGGTAEVQRNIIARRLLDLGSDD